MGVYMDERLQRSDLPDLRKFLDNLPMKPCPSKLPEEYCKICRRLNKDVAHYCKTRKLPEKPKSEIPEEDIPLGRLEPLKKEEEIKEPPEIHRGSPILERPTFKDGDTSLEFVSSQRSIEEAKKSLPRFIPVRKGPRTFRPLEDEVEMEFEAFSTSRSSIFKEPSLLGHDEEDMMFTMVDDDAIEVLPVEVLSDDSYTSETVFSSADGVVEVIEDHEDTPLMTFDEEIPAFEFMPSDEGEIVEAEIVEAEIVEDEPTFQTYTTQEQLKDTKQGIQDLTEEITDMTKSLDKEFKESEFGFRPYHPEAQEKEQLEPQPYEPEKADMKQEIPAEPSEMRFKIKDEIEAEKPKVPLKKIKKKKKMKMKVKKTKKKRIKRTRKKKPEELEPIGDHAFIPPTEELEPEPMGEEPFPKTPQEEAGPEPTVEEPLPETPIEESEPIDEEPFPDTPIEEHEPIGEEPFPEAPQEEPSEIKFKIKDEIEAEKPKVPLKKIKKKMKLKKTKKKKPKDLEPIDDHAFKPQVEEPEPEPIVEEPFPETPIEEPGPIEEEPYPETPQEEPEPEPTVEESFPETPIEEHEPIAEEQFPVPPWIESQPEQTDEESVSDTPIKEHEPIGEDPFPETPREEPELIVDESFPGEPESELKDEDLEGELPGDAEFPPPETEIGFTPYESVELAEGGPSDLYMCPSCGAFVSGSASKCIKCGYDFEAEEEREQLEEPPYEPFEETPTSDRVTFKSKSREGLPKEEGIAERKPKKKKKKKVKLKKKKKMKLKKVKKK
jgi:hypothetical protein